MPGIKDFLFGADSLKKAAGPSDVKTPAQPAGLDMGKLAQDSADRSKSATAPASTKSPQGSPLSTTMTPMIKKGK